MDDTIKIFYLQAGGVVAKNFFSGKMENKFILTGGKK